MTAISTPDAAASSDPGDQFWRGVLLGGGFTSVPRWTRTPTVGIAEHQVKIPDELAAALGRLAAELGVRLSSVFLAAHAKVLAALSGEREIATGYIAAEGREPLPCRLTTEPGSWRGLVLEAQGAESALLSHKQFPVSELRQELRLTEPAFETVFDPVARDAAELAHETVLSLGIVQADGPGLRLVYRTDVLDAQGAARTAGYHLTALTLMAADPDAEHRRQSLLSAEELHYQLEGLAGPRRELPDRRVHELFEDCVRAHPNAVAAVYRDRQWTYRELNARANRLARALLARGLRREDVVAVVTERNLDWMAAMLAIFKAGGAYLPIEPQFPADRITTMLSRAGCRLVLTEPASAGTLGEALDSLSGVETLLTDEAYEQQHSEDDLGLRVAPDQLAYVLFTSGSTGEPKGAMCEHAGMLNHLLAKIDDLRIGSGQVVAQTAPQCFDISLWQLLSPVIVGGRTLLVEQAAVMDAGRFLETIVEGRVNVLQVVPSYLEALLADLEQHPRELPDLRYVSVTGEAVKKELTHRWFSSQPAISLMNAYGLTETSDDTNHDMMDRAPAGDRVPLGRPVNNVHAYVLDEYLSPVPLGAAGEIVFSGVCVGRGYINDPERTRRTFVPDPHRKGERLYRTGDSGRWRPDGKLEFLGRRDTQVKISGFRIELGEIENALLRAPGVRDGAVVIRERADGSKRLVAFYSAPRRLEGNVLRDTLAESLPEYMVPSAFHWRAILPLSPNGKIDRKVLTALAGELEVTEQESEGPRTATEDRLADAWAKVLGVPKQQIGRRDHFFELGGTSLSAVKLAIAMDRAVSFRDLTEHPILAELAALIDGGTKPPSRLLLPLSETEGPPDRALVCFPYAGGNAVNFQAMASALRESGLAVYAVELPGHDLGAEESFAPIREVAERVVEEIVGLGLTRLLLWGHSAGTALVLETARTLEKQGLLPERVFLGAHLLGDAAQRRTSIVEVSRRNAAELADALRGDGGYTELRDLDPERAQAIGAAYRHDYVSANEYLAELFENPPGVRLSAPLTVVVAGDDPDTSPSQERYRDWELVAERVDLHELSEGGHYFLRTRPVETAEAVLAAIDSPPSVSSASN